jgi:hypothetical protein
MFLPISPAYLKPFISLADANAKLTAALGSTLGNYTPNLKALYIVRDPTTEPPTTLKTTGLECLVFPPDYYSQPLHQNALLVENWRIRLIQRDRKKDTMDGYRALLQFYPQITKNSLIPANRDLNEQLNLTLTFAQLAR